jgi:predicted nucleic acid-binding protein
MAPEVVCNAGPLIHLAAVGRLEMLRDLFSIVHIPSAVYHEVVTHGGTQAGAAEVASAVKDGWIRRDEVRNRAAVTLLLDEIHAGEAEAIVPANQLACKVLLDDGYARIKAARLGLTVSGTIGVLLVAWESGRIAGLKPDLDKLVAFGFHLDSNLYARLCSLKDIKEV